MTVVLLLACFRLTLALTPSGVDAAGSETAAVVGRAASYERWVRAPAPWPVERRVGGVVRDWAIRRGLALEEDNRLAWVARSGLTQVPRAPDERINLDGLRGRLHHLGWTDGVLSAVSLRVPRASNVERALVAELDARLGTMVLSHVGIAARMDGDDTTMLLLFSQRLLQLWPVPAQVRRRQQLSVSGVTAALGVTTIVLAVGRPNGVVYRVRVPMDGQEFSTAVDVGGEAGVLAVQLLVDRGHGPEVAAQFPVGVGKPPRESVSVLPDVDDASDQESDPESLRRRLTALVLGVRKAAKVSLPASSTLLDDVASAHLTDMRRHGFFAHVSPQAGNLVQRLAARGVIAGRALENLARARDADEVLRQWLASPSHRANLLDVNVGLFGVAIEPLSNDEVLAVLILTRS